MFRITIRELALLTLAVAMGLAWWLDRSDLANKTKRAILERKQVTAERDEYRTALVELHSAISREGFSTARLKGGKTFLVDFQGHGPKR